MLQEQRNQARHMRDALPAVALSAKLVHKRIDTTGQSEKAQTNTFGQISAGKESSTSRVGTAHSEGQNKNEDTRVIVHTDPPLPDLNKRREFMRHSLLNLRSVQSALAEPIPMFQGNMKNSSTSMIVTLVDKLNSLRSSSSLGFTHSTKITNDSLQDSKMVSPYTGPQSHESQEVPRKLISRDNAVFSTAVYGQTQTFIGKSSSAKNSTFRYTNWGENDTAEVSDPESLLLCLAASDEKSTHLTRYTHSRQKKKVQKKGSIR